MTSPVSGLGLFCTTVTFHCSDDRTGMWRVIPYGVRGWAAVEQTDVQRERMDEDTTSRWHSLLMGSVGGSTKRALELGNPGLCCLRSFLSPRFLLSSSGSQKWEEAMGGLWHLPQHALHHRCLSLTVVLWCVCLYVFMCAHARASMLINSTVLPSHLPFQI